MNQNGRLAGKVAIVTGAASGIGAETARVFAREGARVVLCDRQDALGEAAARAIVDAGGAAEYRPLDVCDEAAWAVLVETVERARGRIDALVNSAGISGREGVAVRDGNASAIALETQSLESWNRVMAVNATGTFLGTRGVIGPMRRIGGGSVVNISSICGIVGSFANAAYHASKGAVRVFSKSAAIQYARDGIRVNSIHPGFVDTPMTNHHLLGNEVVSARLAATPLGRFGTPADIAAGCLYLASDEAGWVTGSELVIDGGMTAN